MEERLIIWIKDQRTLKLTVSMKDICSKAKEVVAEIYSKDKKLFQASNRWFDKFIDRNNISRRTPTHIIQQIQDNALQEIKDYLKEIHKKRTQIEVSRELGDFQKTIIQLKGSKNPSLGIPMIS